ncbi:hypothetical protein [Cardinium endosymbiont of Dermatophagoides farinae]|uniref:hypothetical protein n=1 Tax=Cardinium endosymbiont of Dermatophagoides farinae TaxID=2597823 RepID=UPI001183014A|nr:hypothetical protein [Cardinium endosymbiont of Dermatophagoides farinae]TSJ80089.1 hypothetical protein FPG78_06365 [Cardinium endosymbiont of Dermatophagoides farinae]
MVWSLLICQFHIWKGRTYDQSTSSSETCHSNTQGHHTTHGENITIHEQELIKPNEFSSFGVGFFAGKVVESDNVFFQEQFKEVSSMTKTLKMSY